MASPNPFENPDVVADEEAAPKRAYWTPPPTTQEERREDAAAWAEATPVALFVEHDGVESARDHPDPEAVETFIKQLTPADIRYEMLVTSAEAARMLSVTHDTLRTWRKLNQNLPFYRRAIAGGRVPSVYYRVGDIIRYREFVMIRVSPTSVLMPPPGVMGMPPAPLSAPPPGSPEAHTAPAADVTPLAPPGLS